MEGRSAPDDRILPETRWTFLVFALILISAVIVIWGTPDRTADRWAWTIQPDMTPIFMGSVYAAGAFVFIRLFRSPVWHPYAPVLIGGLVLTSLLLASTLIHWDRFNHGDGPLPADLAFYGWVGIYALAPFWIGFLWLRNRGADPGDDGEGARVPGAARQVAAIGGLAAVIVAALMLLWPTGAIDNWPWDLTPLTARVLGSYVATIGVLGILLATDARWSSWRVIVQTLLVFIAFLLVGSARATGDFHDGLGPWIYLAIAVGGAAGLVAFYASMERPRSGRTRG